MKLRMRIFSLLMLTYCIVLNTYAQPDTEIEFKDKPKRYENRKLRAEKTPDKKFGVVTRVFQNNFSHYNYYFNANVKLNELLARAKAAHRDNYDSLLSYYNYSLDVTAQDRQEIDSIIFKSTAGIALHDLRSSWVDNLYMLIGKAYFFRNDMDSAYQTFQYINYAFAPKESGGYDIPIGSNASNTDGVFTIATNEKKNIIKKAITHPPSRNEALLWLTRVFIETNKTGEAIGLLQMLNNDPNFPKRLQLELAEINGYLHYRQKNYDSAAHYILASIKNADDGTDKARREYLVAQLYLKSGQSDLAVEYFNKSAKHTADPVMEVNATLNAIRNGNSSAAEVQKRIDELLKIGKKDRYEQYRDIIYFTAARAEIDRKNYAAGEKLLLKSIEKSTNNAVQKNASFLLLADTYFNTKNYVSASAYYDSIDVNQVTVSEKNRVELRKPSLKKIASNISDVKKQDSLQYLASLSETERAALLKKLNKKNKKKKQQDDEDENLQSYNTGVVGPALGSNINTPPPDLFAASSKGEWYFNSQNLKSKGFTEFQTRWGKRPNVDNWRRQEAVEKAASLDNMKLTDVDVVVNDSKETEAKTKEAAIDILPVTPQEIAASNSIIEKALLENADLFTQAFNDYESAQATYKELLKRFPEAKSKEEALFRLAYVANKNGNTALADSAASVLQTQHKESKWAKVINNPKALEEEKKQGVKTYENIYNLFVEGRFEEAEAAKLKADSMYGNEFWTQQLLFIESIYYIKQQQDSIAIQRLNALITKDGQSPLAVKAASMIDVLKRRKEIEAYLTNLNVEKKEDEEMSKPVDLNDATLIQQPKKDLTASSSVQIPVKPLVNKVDSIKVNKPVAPITAPAFSFEAADKHFVVVVLDKVDQVFVNESRNSFNRFNKERYYNQQIPLAVAALDQQYQLLLMGPFNDAGEAVNYIDKTKPLTAARILPWLAAGKYSYIIISDKNLQILKENKDLDGYRQMLKQALPGF